MKNSCANATMLNRKETARTAALLEGVLELCEAADIPRVAVIAVLSKVLVLACLPDEDKEQFLARLSYVYDFETFMRPDSQEIH